MSYGSKAFTDEELSAAFPTPKQFFNDGVTRDIVILGKELVPYTTKAGENKTRVDWTVADAKTLEQYVVRFDFAFQDAMRPFKNDILLEKSVYRVTPTQTGEYNGYPRFSYVIEANGEVEAPKEVPVAKAGF